MPRRAAYILAPQAHRGRPTTVISAERADIKAGNAMPLKNMPIGTIVHNVEMKIGHGGQSARSAGTYVQLVGRDAGYAQLKLSSGELRIVRGECMATIGAVSNPTSRTSRWARPAAIGEGHPPACPRASWMNPVDHPHGGGEGRTSGGRHPVTPWGKGTKGNKTRNNKVSDRMIIRRRKQEVGRSYGTFSLEGSLPSTASSSRRRTSRAHRVATEIIKIWVAAVPTILPQFVGLTFGVYNGQKFHPGFGDRQHDRPQVRRILADAHLLTGTRRTRSRSAKGWRER